MTLAEVNQMDRPGFTEKLGWIFEHSPWVAERAFYAKPFPTPESLHRAMTAVVDRAGNDEQLGLIRAHPDLGARARMSAASVGEQAGAGLDALTSEEFELLQELNNAYKQKFEFPFIYAVKGSTKHDVLAALALRLESDTRTEQQTALTEIARIAWFRLSSALETEETH